MRLQLHIVNVRDAQCWQVVEWKEEKVVEENSFEK